MDVLIVYHGRPVRADRRCTGGELRADAHLRALRGAGYTVGTLSRAQDGPGGFASPGELRRMAMAARPGWILCVAPEEAPALAGIAPLVVDLYAPRLLEAAWEERQAEEAGRTLQAIHAADQVLLSNPRQRWFYMGVLGLCGWDLRAPPGLLVPLSTLPPELWEGEAGAGEGAGEGEERYLILGGSPWPWQDASAALALAGRIAPGRVRAVGVAGLPPGVIGEAPGPLGAWLARCRGAAAVLDRYAPNPERELALSFRQLDALSAGTPLITGSEMVIAPEVEGGGAGWVVDSGGEGEARLEAVIREALTDDLSGRRAGVRALAARYAVERTHAPLLSWRPLIRDRDRSALRSSAQAARAAGRAEQERTLREAAEAEVEQKRAELAAAQAQIRALCGSVEAVSAAIADVAGFRREAAAVLGSRLAGEEARAEQWRRELEIARADLWKKERELEALRSERGRLESVIRRLWRG